METVWPISRRENRRRGWFQGRTRTSGWAHELAGMRGNWTTQSGCAGVEGAIAPSPWGRSGRCPAMPGGSQPDDMRDLAYPQLRFWRVLALQVSLTLIWQGWAMSNYRRPQIPGAKIFVTVAVARRGSSLLVDHIAALRDAVRVTRRERPFGVDAWVILPDHFHAVWSMPEGDAAYSVRVGAIKARFTRNIRRAGFRPPPPGPVGRITAGRVRTDGCGGTGQDAGLKPGLPGDETTVWQKRFWEHHIRDAVDWENHLSYCWHNPLKHGLVSHPRDWPFSSWHRDHA